MKAGTLRLKPNLGGLSNLTVLPLQCLHLLSHVTRQTCTLAAVDLGLLDPFGRVAGEQPI